jgi:hypothetical protein
MVDRWVDSKAVWLAAESAEMRVATLVWQRAVLLAAVTAVWRAEQKAAATAE